MPDSTSQCATFIGASEVAQIIGHSSAAAFLNARDRLERYHEFPMPMPTCLRPLKWRREAVVGWIAAQGISPAEPPQAPIGQLRLLQEARRA